MRMSKDFSGQKMLLSKNKKIAHCGLRRKHSIYVKNTLSTLYVVVLTVKATRSVRRTPIFSSCFVSVNAGNL